jgi:hypothetical protein
MRRLGFCMVVLMSTLVADALAEDVTERTRDQLQTLTRQVGAESLEAEVELLRRDEPSLVDAIFTAEPSGETRQGRPRFLSDAFSRPEAWPLIEYRLRHHDDDLGSRLGLIAWLPQVTGWLPRAESLLDDLVEPELRTAIVFMGGRAKQAEVLPLLVQGLHDKHPSVRAAAARGLAGISGADEDLRGALADVDSAVRAGAAFSVGVRGDLASRDGLERMLSDDSADARLDALRALERLMGPKARDLALLPSLIVDPDPRIQARARRIVAR